MSDILDLGFSLERAALEKTVERLRSPGLRHLAVNTGFSIDDFDFSPLSSHERIEGLSVFDVADRLSSIDKILMHIKGLEVLSITHASPINDDTIRSIASINGLKLFRLWNPVNSISGVDWSPLGDCESLESVDIEGARLRTIDLTFAGRL
jgi:hypothetical protein